MENMEQAQSQPAHSEPPQEDVPVTLTAKAVEMVKITRDQEGIDPSHGLRVAVRGGGCSGFEYALDFENEARDSDWVYEQGDLKVYVDAVSARYLAGHQHRLRLRHRRRGVQVQQPQGRRHLRLRLLVRGLSSPRNRLGPPPGVE